MNTLQARLDIHKSNGGAERAVHAAKMLMKKAFEDGVDSHMSLLNQRNTPQDSKLGSPAQRLMSRQTKTLLHIAEELLKPEIKDPKVVQEQLQMYRAQQKKILIAEPKSCHNLEKGMLYVFVDKMVSKEKELYETNANSLEHIW